jgi:hypothetical protein
VWTVVSVVAALSPTAASAEVTVRGGIGATILVGGSPHGSAAASVSSGQTGINIGGATWIG